MKINVDNIVSNVIHALAWVVVVAYVIFAMHSARVHRSAQRVESVDILLTDSSATNRLLTSAMVEQWIEDSKIQTIGCLIDSLELNRLEQRIKADGIVENVKAYATYNGKLVLSVDQREVVVRVMLNGYNSYASADNFIFRKPEQSACFVPVVTGDYLPIFGAGYVGSLADTYKVQYDALSLEISRIEKRDKYPLYERRNQLNDALHVVNTRYIGRRYTGESRQDYAQRIEDLKARNARERKEYLEQLDNVARQIKEKEKKQNVFVEKQKKLTKKYEDFINLITFVSIIENDDFWSSEIVQLVASESAEGRLCLELIARSGSHTITFGTLDDIESKLSGLKRFYDRVLPTKKWGQVENISVEYAKQVVCKDRK